MKLIADFKAFFAPEIEIYSVKKHDTRYSITQKGSMAFFKVDGIVYSQLDNKSIYTHSYHDKFLLLPLIYERSRILIIGLGAGTVPYQLSELYHRKVSTDVVELSPDYVALTERFLPKGGVDFNIIIESGEKFVEKQANKYDIIIQDVYQDAHVPAAFLQDKFMEDAYKALRPDGILAINYAPEVVYLPIYMHNLSKHFRYVYRIKHISLGNYIIICSKTLNKAKILERLNSRIEIDSGNKYLLKAYKSMG